MTRRIKVLHLINNMDDGGAQRIILNYLNDLCNDNDIELKALVYSDKTNSYCNKIIEKNCYNVDYLYKDIHNKYIRKVLKVLYGNTKLTKYVRKYNPDIIHVHISSFLTTCLKPIIECNVPIRFDTLHSNPYRFNGKNLKNIRDAFQNENFIGICVTNEQVNQAIDHYGMKKYEVVRNGIDINKIQKQIISKNKSRNLFHFDDSVFVIGAVGRLDKVKRFDFLLKIFAEILKQKNNSVLVIAGDGPEKSNLVNFAKELGIYDKIHFIGNIDNIIELYCALDVLAITSQSESSSLVLIESQVCGVRSVISNGVPNESIVTNYVKKMDSEASIYDWCNALLDKDYVGKKYLNISDYDVHMISKKIKEIYIKYWEEYKSNVE